jgi:hypothetical protein
MSHRFLYSNMIGASATIAASSAAAGFVGGAVPRVANGPGSVVFSGSYTGDGPEVYTAEIDSGGDVGAATFKWRKASTSGGGWEASGITTALTDIALEAGVNVRFLNGSSSPAFEAGDRWQATATRFRSPARVIDLDPATKWRSIAPPADPEFVAADLGSAQAPDAVILHGHNISSGATVKIQGGPVPQDYSADMDGAASGISIPDTGDLSFGDSATDSPFSVCGWIKMDTASNFAPMSKGSGAAREWHFGLLGDTGTKYELALYDDTGAVRLARMSDTTYAGDAGSWIFIAASYDGGGLSSGIKVYRGALTAAPVELAASDHNAGVYTAMHNQAQPATIGRVFSDDTRADGHAKDVRVYNKVLSLSEIQQIHAGTFTDAANLTGHWPLNEGTGTTAADSSGNGNDGALQSGDSWSTDAPSPVDETVTWAADTMHRYLTTSARSFRYWRLLASGDSGNADGYLEIAELFLGGYFEPAYGYEFGNVLGEEAFEEARETENRADKTILLNRGRTAALPYRHVTAAEKASFLAMFRAVKDTDAERSLPLFAHLDLNDADSVILATLAGPFAPVEEGPDDFAFELELRERIA